MVNRSAVVAAVCGLVMATAACARTVHTPYLTKIHVAMHKICKARQWPLPVPNVVGSGLGDAMTQTPSLLPRGSNEVSFGGRRDRVQFATLIVAGIAVAATLITSFEHIDTRARQIAACIVGDLAATSPKRLLAAFGQGALHEHSPACNFVLRRHSPDHRGCD